jgi:hypothetical protein
MFFWNFLFDICLLFVLCLVFVFVWYLFLFGSQTAASATPGQNGYVVLSHFRHKRKALDAGSPALRVTNSRQWRRQSGPASLRVSIFAVDRRPASSS